VRYIGTLGSIEVQVMLYDQLVTVPCMWRKWRRSGDV
jgi:hypothetical protein